MMKWLDGQRDELARSLLTADTSGCSIIIRGQLANLSTLSRAAGLHPSRQPRPSWPIFQSEPSREGERA